MSGKNGSNGSNGADWTKVFIEFRDRHKDEKYTIVFNAAMDGFIACPDIPLTWRVLAWIWRNSWGNSSDHCVAKIGGPAIGQSACAEAFKVTKQRVNDCVVALREFNFVLASTGHRLQPVDDPARIDSPPDNSANPKSPGPSGLFNQFCDEWKVRALADFQELESAEAVVNRIKKVRWGLFKKWRRARTSGGASLYKTEELQTEEKQQQQEQPAAAPPPPPDLVVVAQKLNTLGTISEPAAQKFLNNCQKASPGCTAADINGVIDRIAPTLGREIRNPIGVLIKAVPPAIAQYRREASATPQLSACYICTKPIEGASIQGAHFACYNARSPNG